jgi:hypothetical protein
VSHKGKKRKLRKSKRTKTEYEVGLGRLDPVPDRRDAAFPMRMEIGTIRELPASKYWFDDGIWIDQGNESTCVGATFTHLIEDSPIPRPESPQGTSIIDYRELYREAQLRDEWPGTDYEGTSARGACKVLADRGLIGAYLWANTVQDIIDAVSTKGPVAFGSNWYESMFSPRYVKDATGQSRWMLVIDESDGGVAGGHQYLINGVNMPARVFRVKNSWGRWWGTEGRASISFDTLERLLYEQGDAVLVTELKVA